jgi:sortase A
MCLTTMSRRRGDIIVLCLLLIGIQQLGGAVLIQAKAALAPLLIEKAWAQTLNTGKQVVKPWPWADTWPVGRLRVEDLDQDLFILEGDTGNALAFGPGRALPSAKLGEKGAAVIGGHRDTHFAFLQQLQKGHVLELQLASGERREYQVSGLRIVDASQETLSAETIEEALLLVTCYPFDALQAGGPLRYVVTAVPKGDRFAVL